MYCVNHGPPPPPSALGLRGNPIFIPFSLPSSFAVCWKLFSLVDFPRLEIFGGSFRFRLFSLLLWLGGGEWKMKDLYVSFFHSHFRKYRILLLWEYSC